MTWVQILRIVRKHEDETFFETNPIDSFLVIIRADKIPHVWVLQKFCQYRIDRIFPALTENNYFYVKNIQLSIWATNFDQWVLGLTSPSMSEYQTHYGSPVEKILESRPSLN